MKQKFMENQKRIAAYISFYNHDRPHSYLRYQTQTIDEY